jgi:hypothetical protein
MTIKPGKPNEQGGDDGRLQGVPKKPRQEQGNKGKQEDEQVARRGQSTAGSQGEKGTPQGKQNSGRPGKGGS